MKSKRLVILVLVMLIFASIITGCGQTNKDAQGEKTSNTSTNTMTAQASDEQDAFKEPMTISVSQWDDGTWEQKSDDTWLKDFGKKFNVIFKPVVITWDDWQNKTRMWAASGNLPDMFVHDENYAEWVKQGLFKAIPQMTLDKYPNIKKNIMPNVLQALTVNGNIYSIPRSHFADASQAMALNAIYVRKDYLQKAGLNTPPDTLDDWYNFFKKAVTEDFSGTGKTVGLKGSSLLLSLPFIHTSDNWIEEDGKWIPTAFSKKHINELQFSRKLYKEGIIDKDFSIRKVFDERKLFQQGRMAVIEANGDPGMLYQQVTSDMENVSPKDFITLSLPPKADDGNRYFPYTLNYWSYTGISPKVSDDKMTRILSILDYLGTPEGQLLSIFGKEGTDFKSKDGSKITSPSQSDNIESLLPKDPSSGKQKSLQDTYPSSWFGMAFLSWNTWSNFINPVFTPETRKMSVDYFDSLRENTTVVAPNLKIMFMSSPQKNKMPDLNALYNELYVKIVMTDVDIETTFNRWVNEQMKKYGAVIDEVNNNLK